MGVLNQVWKDFAEFWKSQVFWAALASGITAVIQWRKGLFSGSIGGNALELAIPYAGIILLFAVGNIGRTVFRKERDAARKKLRAQRREEHRAELEEHRAKVAAAKPPAPKPNLQFRRVFRDRMWFGHEISGHAHDCIAAEIGNELTGKEVGQARGVRAHITYLNTDKKILQIRCPGTWRGQEEKEYIPVGESRNLILAINAGSWKTALFEGIDLPQSVIAEVRLLDEAGECFAEVIAFQLGFTNANNPVFKRIQAAS